MSNAFTITYLLVSNQMCECQMPSQLPTDIKCVNTKYLHASLLIFLCNYRNTFTGRDPRHQARLRPHDHLQPERLRPAPVGPLRHGHPLPPAGHLRHEEVLSQPQAARGGGQLHLVEVKNEEILRERKFMTF